MSKLEDSASAAAQQAASTAIALQDARRDTKILQKALADARLEIERMQQECDVNFDDEPEDKPNNAR